MTCRTRLWCAVVLVLVSNGAVAAAQARIASYRELPYGACRFAQEQLHFTPDPWQEEVLVAFADPQQKRISLQACAGPGKTAIEVVCGWYFLATQVSQDSGGYEHPKGLCTSVTADNLRDNLWAEFAKWQSRSEYLTAAFTWTRSLIHQVDHEATWFLAARSWPKTGNADEQGRTFSGLHGKNILVILDESGAIPPTVLRAGEQALPNTHFGKLLQGGNPISLEGSLYEAANRLKHLWTIIRVTGDPDEPRAWVNVPRVNAGLREGEQSPREWAAEQIQTYGRDNPWVKAYILGEFPQSSLNTLLSLEQVEAAIARRLQPAEYEHMQKRLGIDVARFGDDRTVIFPRQGLQTYRPTVLRGARTTDIAARAFVAKQKFGSELEFIDDTGHWGHGVIDNLVAAGTQPHAVVFHAPALSKRFKNRRVEMWIAMADAIKGGTALPSVVPELVAELTTPTYTFHNGVFLLEDKDQVKKRLGRSPDLADALALTYALPDMPGQLLERLRAGGAAGQNGQALTEWDAFKDA